MKDKKTEQDKLSEFARIMGSKGGHVTSKKYGTEYFKKIRALVGKNKKNSLKIGT